jgi:predicted peptidase
VSDFSRLKTLPIWVVHGTRDDTHDYGESVRAVKAIEALGGEPFLRLSTTSPEGDEYLHRMHIFSSIENGPHDVWTMTYSSPQLYAWLLRFTRP